MTDLKNKVAIVTGASRGIGREISIKLAEEGAKVALFARDETALNEVSEYIRSKGGTCISVICELTDETSIKEAVKTVKDTFGTIDCLVNNAGRMELYPVHKTPTEIFDSIIGINLRGVFLLTREVLPVMLEKNFGKIVNIGSTAGRRGYPEQSAYCASKHALVGFTKALSLELRKTKVSTCIVAPGGVLTDMSKKLMASRGDFNEEAWITPQQITDGVMFVLHQDGAAFTDELVIRRFESEPWR